MRPSGPVHDPSALLAALANTEAQADGRSGLSEEQAASVPIAAAVTTATSALLMITTGP